MDVVVGPRRLAYPSLIRCMGGNRFFSSTSAIKSITAGTVDF